MTAWVSYFGAPAIFKIASDLSELDLRPGRIAQKPLIEFIGMHAMIDMIPPDCIGPGIRRGKLPDMIQAICRKSGLMRMEN